MKRDDKDNPSLQSQDKQLQGIAPDAVMEKRRLDQALNAKEFAVCAGISYSTARKWFHLPGFPVFDGVVFWNDFVQWRAKQTGLIESEEPALSTHASASLVPLDLPSRAAQILLDR